MIKLFYSDHHLLARRFVDANFFQLYFLQDFNHITLEKTRVTIEYSEGYKLFTESRITRRNCMFLDLETGLKFKESVEYIYK